MLKDRAGRNQYRLAAQTQNTVKYALGFGALKERRNKLELSRQT